MPARSSIGVDGIRQTTQATTASMYQQIYQTAMDRIKQCWLLFLLTKMR